MALVKGSFLRYSVCVDIFLLLIMESGKKYSMDFQLAIDLFIK